MLHRTTGLVGVIAIVLGVTAGYGWAQETVGGTAATECDMAAMCAQIQASAKPDAVTMVAGEAATECDMAAYCAAEQAGAIVPERDPAQSKAPAATECDMAAMCADMLADKLSGE